MRTKIIVRENSHAFLVRETSRCVYVNFLQTEGSNDINRGNFATKTKIKKKNKIKEEKKECNVAKRKSVGNYNIHFDKRK